MKKFIVFVAFSLVVIGVSAQNVGIGTNTPDASAKLHVVDANRGVLISNVVLTDVTVAAPVTTPATGLLVWNTNAAVTGGSGAGYYYWDGTQWVNLISSSNTLGADNGLYENNVSNTIRLGGPLLENTTVTNGTFNMTYNLDATGDFIVQDAGIPHFQVGDNGFTYFGDNSQWRDGNAVTGTIFAQIYDDVDDGHMILYENGGVQIDLDANGVTTFNQQGLDRDFVVESDLRTSALHVDALNNVVRFGLAAGSLSGNGTTVGGTVIDYVADFDAGGVEGTAVGIGSIEYMLDGNARTKINNAFVPTTHLNRDLGFSTTVEAWDDVYADNFVNVSDIRAKENITDNVYGISEIMGLSTITYELIEDPFNERKIGIIAQEALQLIPEAVKTHDYKILDETKPTEFEKVELERMGVKYNAIVPVLIKATQEQQEIIETQNDKIEKLEKELEEIKRLLQAK